MGCAEGTSQPAQAPRRFRRCGNLLDDETAMTIAYEHPDEERFVTLGSDALGRILVVVYTWRRHRIRLISARRATPGERRQYEGKR